MDKDKVEWRWLSMNPNAISILENDYQLTNDKIEHYKTHVDKVIKIQSVMRRRYWWKYFISFWWEIGNSGTTSECDNEIPKENIHIGEVTGIHMPIPPGQMMYICDKTGDICYCNIGEGESESECSEETYCEIDDCYYSKK